MLFRSLTKITEKNKRFYIEKVCTKCKGFRFNNDTLKYKVYNKNIGQLYTMEITDLIEWILKRQQNWEKNKEETIYFKSILFFLNKLVELNLGYLNLNRSIPSLSGGELQRLKLCQSINSQFSNFIYILDEPTSGLHPSEWKYILNAIKKLKTKKNTIILIEHNNIFKTLADKIIVLGSKRYNTGGELIIPEENKKIDFNFNFFKSKNSLNIDNESYNNIKNLSLSVPLNTLVAVCGKSGSGKTSFLKGILLKYVPAPTYLKQSPIRGNSYSIIATYIDIFTEIKTYFSETHNKNIDYFSFSHSAEGRCLECNGSGKMNQDKSSHCSKCEGKRFNKNTLSYKIKQRNIYDILNLNINELKEFIPVKLTKTHKIINFFQILELGHLNLFREISSLSGGEAQRIKLCTALFKYKTPRTYLLDEPFKGLDKDNKKNILKFLYEIIKDGNSIFIIEHDIFSIKNSSYIIEFGPDSGNKGGEILYSGESSKIYESSKSIIKNYLN